LLQEGRIGTIPNNLEGFSEDSPAEAEGNGGDAATAAVTQRTSTAQRQANPKQKP